MKRKSFTKLLSDSETILTEGAVIERLRRNPSLTLNPHVYHAGFVYEPSDRDHLEKLYRQYMDAGFSSGLPILICTPTWRAGKERTEKAGYPDVNQDAFRFMDNIRRTYGEYAEKIFIGGLIGPKGDAYHPEEALSEKEAFEYHRFQVQELTQAGADFLMAATLPALSEAAGISRAMAESGIPYIPSFVIRPSGTLLDGTPLHKAVSVIDSQVAPPPVCYLVNCVHPSVFHEAVSHEMKMMPDICRRIMGLQANTSAKSPEELENSEQLETENPASFAESMLKLHKSFGIKILGGCCGSDDRHIKEIAEKPGGNFANPNNWRRTVIRDIGDARSLETLETHG
ncbi:MAG: homocysteine S-methyltransferase family protein, partial [Desulfococcaceae bacterium]|nr:homocysteine S-methyltransferase family protein [Desulfococcaceae bacterium]